jgi:hypothetical protein
MAGTESLTVRLTGFETQRRAKDAGAAAREAACVVRAKRRCAPRPGDPLERRLMEPGGGLRMRVTLVQLIWDASS